MEDWRIIQCVVCEECTHGFDDLVGWRVAPVRGNAIFVNAVCPACAKITFGEYLDTAVVKENRRYDIIVENMGELDCNAHDSLMRLHALWRVLSAWKLIGNE